ncbi:MFS transporter [Streptomyces sp. NPDC051445]|uniref:MFS transporter n=1 Tax=Streptomyces sp. NPDC051445 TaxID=3365653 RepID=UPI003787AC98
MSATLYAYAFLDEFVLLYPVYALLFADSGLSVGQISSLFVLWSLTGVLLEVPTGVWADAVSRRLLLWTGPLLGAAGFALWVLFPSYWAFAAGFVLWGARGALGSGALEALVYEELDRAGAADRYARTMGRAHAVGQLAVMTATGLAGPVFAVGGYPAVGTASVLACLLCAVTATRFPEHRTAAVAESDAESDAEGESDGGVAGDGCGGGGGASHGGADGEGGGGNKADGRGGTPGAAGLTRLYGRLGLSGLSGLRRERPLLGALLLVPAVTAVWGALDEYTPLLVRETGAPDTAVPYLLMVIWAGVTAGSLLAGAAERLGRTGLAALLAGAALALAAGALTGAPAGIALVALAFGGFQAATVLADVRLQQRIEGTARATLTSLAGLGTELVTIVVYGAYGVLGAGFAHGTEFALCAVPYLLTALVVGRRSRGQAPEGEPGEQGAGA